MMDHVSKFIFTMVQFVVYINICRGQKEAIGFLGETFKFMYQNNNWVPTLRQAKQIFISRKHRDWNDKRLMQEVDKICSGILVISGTQRPPVYRTDTTVACIFLNFIMENAPSDTQQGPQGDFGNFPNIATRLYFTPHILPGKDIENFLRENMRPAIAADFNAVQYQAFVQYCRRIVDSRWDQQMQLVMPCSIVRNYAPFLQP